NSIRATSASCSSCVRSRISKACLPSAPRDAAFARHSALDACRLPLVQIEGPQAPDAEEVAALLVVEIVAERTLLAVLEEQPDETRTTGNDRRALLDHRSLAPLLVVQMHHAVAEPQIDPLVLGRVLHRRRNLPSAV